MRVADLRVLVPLLERVRIGEKPTFRMRSAARFLLHRLGKPSKKGKSCSAKARKTAKAVQHRGSTASIREAVMQRAAGKCEHCGGEFYPWDAPEMDHFMGGGGRRRQAASIETCWLLHRFCHLNRTNNYPTAAYWNGSFARHCQKHRYFTREHIIHQQLSTQGSEASIPPNTETPVLGRKEEA
jgi:5-methylcytosine-specific restriction endonuclease McrA